MRWTARVGAQRQPFPEKGLGRGYLQLRGQFEELLLREGRWKWGSQQGLGTKDWLSWAHGCGPLQAGVRACRRVPGGAALQEADDLLDRGLLVLVGPPVGTGPGGSGGCAGGAPGWGLCTRPPPHLMPLKVSTACMSSGRSWGSGHSKPSMTGTMFLPQLKAVTISCRKKRGRRKRPGSPCDPGARQTLRGVLVLKSALTSPSPLVF